MPLLAWMAGALLLAATVAFLSLWLVERRHRRLRDLREDSAWEQLDRELEFAEQSGRFRIAGELSDVAVQTVNRLITQAEGARYAAGTDPVVTTRLISALESTARDTLGDLRRVQNVVREGQGAAQPHPRLHSARDLFRMGVRNEWVTGGV